MQEISVYDLQGDTLTNLVQFDKDVYIYINDSRITAAYQVQFFNSTSESALVMNSTYSNNILCVKIPNDLLEQPYAITGYVQVVQSDGTKCLYGFKIAVRKKPKPSDWVYVDSKDYVTFEEVLGECREFANSAHTSAIKASEHEIAASKSATNAKASETSANTSATNALASEKNAEASETHASNSETNAKESEKASAANLIASKEYANVAERAESNALLSETKAKESELQALKSEKNASRSENNSKQSEIYASSYEENAKQYMDRAEFAMVNNETYAKMSQSYAVGGASDGLADSDGNTIITDNGEIICFSFYRDNEEVDNAKYYYEQAKRISIGLSGALLPMGTITYEELSVQTKQAGYMYNISNDFVTDSSFKEGAGISYSMGTNVYYTHDGYWDCLAGTTVTGVKGRKETTYRRGNVNITPENIGALSTEDAETIKTRIGTVESDVSGLKTDMTSAKADITKVKTDISNLQTKTSEIETDVENLETDMSTYVEGLLKTIATLNDTVSLLQKMVYTGKALVTLVDSDGDNITTSDGYNIFAWWNICD